MGLRDVVECMRGLVRVFILFFYFLFASNSEKLLMKGKRSLVRLLWESWLTTFINFVGFSYKKIVLIRKRVLHRYMVILFFEICVF